VRPALREYMGIVCMLPFGFVTSIKRKEEANILGSKQFRMQPGQGKQCIYIKKGWETMACCKPLDLFEKDCEVGELLLSNKRDEGNQVDDRTSKASIDAHKISRRLTKKLTRIDLLPEEVEGGSLMA
jgi:hypothetical protein